MFILQETKINMGSQFAKSVLSEIDDVKKMYRLVNRVSFTHPSFPIRVDLSIVKSSTYDTKTRKVCPNEIWVRYEYNAFIR